ncbi:MAG TPA: PilN domain-containing protein [Trichocoleus sp.]
MYGLDINFLNDRKEQLAATRPVRARSGAAPGDQRPLLFGLLGVVAALGLVAGYWLVLRNQVNTLQARNAELDQELAELQAKLQEANTIRSQIDAVRAENKAFVGVFDKILPWSALLQDIRNRTPNRIQITNLNQTAGATPANQAAAAPAEGQPATVGGVEIQGIACSFNDINDFALVLKQSPLLEADSVRIARSEKQTELLDPQVEGTCPGTPAGEPEYLVDYTVQANLTDAPASQLVEELERQGTVGLVARLRALRETGVLEQ